MKKSTREKIKKMKIGAGECLLASFEGDGEGGQNFALENDKGELLIAASNLHSRRDCELAMACYLLIKNGIEPTVFVHQNRHKKKDDIVVRKKVTQESVKVALGLDRMSTIKNI